MQEQTHTELPVSSGILRHKYDSGRNDFSIGESADFNSPGQLFNPASISTFAGSRFGRDFSQVRLHADEVLNPLPSRRTGLTVQRFSRDGTANSAACPFCPDVESTQTSAYSEPTTEADAPTPEAVPAPEQSEPVEEATVTEAAARQGLIVDDSSTELGPGQMRKSEFLAQLRTEVCRTVEAAIAGSGRSTEDCPYLDHWFGYYSQQDSAHVERAIRRYAPEASNATTARGYISVVTERARQSAETWARTGEITGVPEGIPIGLPGTGLLGSLVSGIGSIFFKARNGGARKAGAPRAIQARLGSGQPIDSGVRSRMESAFSMDFSHVRTHTDNTAAGLSDGLNARAFTVGEHVAFGSGEYKPGSIYGDALIAHELAHVIQQSGSNTSVAPLQTENTGHNVFEEDADKSAVEVLTSLWGGARGKLAHIAQNAIPRLRSGLSLQSCQKETCSEGDKSISVALVKLRGSSRSPSTDLATANKVYKKCCVKFNVGKNETVPNKLSDSWLGGDTNLQWDNTSGVHAEEKSMFDGATKKYKLSSRMRLFFVESLTPANALGYSIPPYRSVGKQASYVNHAVIINSARNDTVAHELGHILINSGDHKGIDNPSDTKNLMYAPGRTGSKLDKSQCKIIYNNA